MIEIFIKKADFAAEGVFENGNVTVRCGSTINPSFAPYIKGITLAREYREDTSVVDKTWTLLKDCVFPSPSTAAQFVMGQSRDGYDAWKVEEGKSLGQYLEEHGLRERKRRKKD